MEYSLLEGARDDLRHDKLCLNWENLEASMDFLSSCGKVEVGGEREKNMSENVDTYAHSIS